MGKHYVVLSFFKANKINYYFDSNRMTIVFPCPYCWEQTKMNAITSEWTCNNCNQIGNLLTLIQVNKEDPIKTKVAVYNPKKERLQINYLFDKMLDLQNNTNSKSTLLKLKNKVNDLIEYYENSV
ncbi:hypothetical protein M3182_00700 [Mesobacillus maritimus]|uniref:hypothetical protein n=1 Tax=Mesobacillus maritimus TaxID=1643336 RepID=UPI002041F64C|nr:hypothetical protein [Mesobacillus maritimus]MCM3584258.1 hypothetical protein [Mesobacillus maritimus]